MSANGNELITLSQFKIFVNAISSEGNEGGSSQQDQDHTVSLTLISIFRLRQNL